MSVKTRRRTLDQYFTDQKLVYHFLRRVPANGVILEPCVGQGHIVRATFDYCQERNQLAPFFFTNDLDPQFEADFHLDAGDPTASVWRTTYDWVLTNAPYNEVHRILPLALAHVRQGVAFLNRWTYLEPAGNRAEWLETHASEMSDLIIFGQPRPSFSGNGSTDTATTAWMVWRPGWTAGTKVSFVYGWNQ